MPILQGTKLGMTRVFTELGVSIPVTVIKFDVHQVVQVKNSDKDGYEAYQLGATVAKELNKPEAGHQKNLNGVVYKDLFEVPTESFGRDLDIGTSLDVSEFESVEYVDVSGLSKGRGFTGVIKRWGFKTQPASHGNSLSGRVTGSLGSNQDPGRVWKNKKMPGHYGNSEVSVQNLKVIRVDKERGVLLVKGAVPGANGFSVIVKNSVKKRGS